MWLSNSSIGRKVVMSLTGLFLILFVTFHVLMNAVALVWPNAYNTVCEFLGANWYALIGTGVIALGALLHIFYAFWLTLQNRKARGNDAYKVTSRPKNVEWASQNMLVLGIIIVCFFVIHLAQFWAKMQVPEAMGQEMEYATGMMFIKDAFSQSWTLPVYLVGFLALWFHLTHGFWSALQTLGTNNETWLPRVKTISCVWATVVCGLFAVEAVVFTVQTKCECCVEQIQKLECQAKHEKMKEAGCKHEMGCKHERCCKEDGCKKGECAQPCEGTCPNEQN